MRIALLKVQQVTINLTGTRTPDVEKERILF